VTLSLLLFQVASWYLRLPILNEWHKVPNGWPTFFVTASKEAFKFADYMDAMICFTQISNNSKSWAKQVEHEAIAHRRHAKTNLTHTELDDKFHISLCQDLINGKIRPDQFVAEVLKTSTFNSPYSAEWLKKRLPLVRQMLLSGKLNTFKNSNLLF
jgi:hypothetical protein